VLVELDCDGCASPLLLWKAPCLSSRQTLN